MPRMKTLIETLDEIEKVAQAATPGPWITGVNKLQLVFPDDLNEYALASCAKDQRDGDYPQHENAKFIALCNPSEILKLTQALKVAMEGLDFYGAQNNWQHMELEDCNDDYELLDKKRRILTGGKRARRALSQIAALYGESGEK